MKHIIHSGEGKTYDWSKDTITIKSAANMTDGQVTLVEDTLKAGFHLARHHHKKMTEVFYILEGQVTYIFDDERVQATAGMTITIPPNTWHEVICEHGGKMLTIFTPGGFEHYLEALSHCTDEQFADADLMRAMSEQYDSWER